MLKYPKLSVKVKFLGFRETYPFFIKTGIEKMRSPTYIISCRRLSQESSRRKDDVAKIAKATIIPQSKKSVSKAEKKEEILFVGKTACVKCHPEEYGFWKKTKHSQAYRALVERGVRNLHLEGCN